MTRLSRVVLGLSGGGVLGCAAWAAAQLPCVPLSYLLALLFWGCCVLLVAVLEPAEEDRLY